MFKRAIGRATAEAVYNTQLDTQQIMSLVLEPASDILWDSAGWVMDAAGYEDLYPTTDEGWDFVRAKPQSLLNLATCLHYLEGLKTMTHG